MSEPEERPKRRGRVAFFPSGFRRELKDNWNLVLNSLCAISCFVATKRETYGGSKELLNNFISLPSFNLKSDLNVVLQTEHVASTEERKQI